MRVIYSTRHGLLALLIRRREGGTASHCALRIDGRIIDSTLRWGVHSWTPDAWAAQGHVIQAEYEVPLPDEAAARNWALARLAEHAPYDVLHLVGYLLWRSIGIARGYACEELQSGALLAGGLTFSDRTARPGIRLLREIAHARAA